MVLDLIKKLRKHTEILKNAVISIFRTNNRYKINSADFISRAIFCTYYLYRWKCGSNIFINLSWCGYILIRHTTISAANHLFVWLAALIMWFLQFKTTFWTKNHIISPAFGPKLCFVSYKCRRYKVDAVFVWQQHPLWYLLLIISLYD